MKNTTLNLEKYISWRKPHSALTLTFVSGDTIVLTVSENGHDATASYLSNSSEPFEVPANTWYTAETLGRESELKIDPVDCYEEIAPDDWRPSPRKALY